MPDIELLIARLSDTDLVAMPSPKNSSSSFSLRGTFLSGFLLFLGMKSILRTLLLICVIPSSLSAQVPDEVLFTDPPSMREHFQWLGDTLLIYGNTGEQNTGQPEFVLFPQERKAWIERLNTLSVDSLVTLYQQKGKLPLSDVTIPSSSALEPPLDPEKPLAGLRIALDPGHMAGDQAFAKEIEGKYMTMPDTPATYQQEIAFYESELTLATAFILKDSLERLGATVMMTRTELGKASHGLTFEEWKSVALTDSLDQAVKRGEMSYSKAIWWKSKATDAAIFKSYYNRSDLHHRINRIREFHPDITIIIHYNVDSPNWSRRMENGDFLPGFENYSMAFVPGSFAPGELARVEDRMMLLRLLISDDYAQSVALSASFITASETYTGVAPVDSASDLSYLAKYSRYAGEPGVFARNLSLTRNLSGAICYGESLCQDARWEAMRLNQRDLVVNGIPVSSRVAEVAQAYLEAVKEFVGERGRR